MQLRLIFIIFIFIFSGKDGFPQEECLFDTTKIIFKAKLHILDEVLLDGSTICKSEDISKYLSELDQLEILYLDSKGFNRFGCKFMFIALGVVDIDNNLYTISPYVLGYVKKKNYFKFYRLAGFVHNDFRIFLNDLPKYIPYTKSEIGKAKNFNRIFSVNGLDFSCLFSALKDRKTKQFHHCLYSNLKFKIHRYNLYYFDKEDKNEVKSREINKLKSMGRFAPIENP